MQQNFATRPTTLPAAGDSRTAVLAGPGDSDRSSAVQQAHAELEQSRARRAAAERVLGRLELNDTRNGGGQ